MSNKFIPYIAEIMAIERAGRVSMMPGLRDTLPLSVDVFRADLEKDFQETLKQWLTIDLPAFSARLKSALVVPRSEAEKSPKVIDRFKSIVSGCFKHHEVAECITSAEVAEYITKEGSIETACFNNKAVKVTGSIFHLLVSSKSMSNWTFSALLLGLIAHTPVKKLDKLWKFFSESKDSEGNTILIRAALNGCADLTPLLIRFGFDFTITSRSKWHSNWLTPLMASVISGSAACFKNMFYEIKSNEDKLKSLLQNAPGELDCIALSACHGNMEILSYVVLYLKQLNQSVLRKYVSGNSAMHYAVISGKVNIVRFLASNGFPIDDVNDQNNAPIAVAIDMMPINVGIVEALLLCGASPKDSYISAVRSLSPKVCQMMETALRRKEILERDQEIHRQVHHEPTVIIELVPEVLEGRQFH